MIYIYSYKTWRDRSLAERPSQLNVRPQRPYADIL